MNYNFNNILFEKKSNLNPFYNNLQFIFDGNSFVIYLSKDINNKSIDEILSETFGSEHWISETSDLFRFDANNQLAYIILNIPSQNKKCDFNFDTKQNEFSMFELKNEKPFILPSSTYRDFSAINKTITCINKNNDLDENFLTKIMLTKDFSLIFYKDMYTGFSLSNPLIYLTNNYNGIQDQKKTIESNEYQFFEDYFNIFSDENIENHDNNIEEVILLIDNLLKNNNHIFKSKIRKKIVVDAVEMLKEFYIN